MVKGKSTWKYNKLVTARRNYFNLGGKIKGLISQGVSSPLGVLGGAAGAVGGLVGNALSGGLDSKAGGVVNGIGNALGSVPILGGFAKGALNIVGGGVNALFGSKLNQENINSVKQSIASVNNITADASDYNELSDIIASTPGVADFNKKYIGKDGLFSNKAGKTFKDLQQQRADANARRAATIAMNAGNITSDINSNLLGSYFAFGGPMDFGGGAIDYDFMNQYLGIKELAALGKDASLGSLPNSFADGGGIHIKKANRGKFTEYCGGKVTSECIAKGKRSSSPAVRKRATFADNARKWKHAFGGDLLTHGANFDTGITVVGNGGTHEENPYEGVPMGVDNEGTPNLVEQGEVIFNDYVFSNRLKVPKEVRKKYKLRGTKPLTFAKAAVLMGKESEERPNDSISRAGLEDSMMKLALAQEQVRTKKGGNKFSKGGKMGRIYAGKEGDPYSQILSFGNGPLDPAATWALESPEVNESQVPIKNQLGIVLGGYTTNPTIIKPGESTIPEIVETQRTKYPSPPTSPVDSDENKPSLAPTWMRYIPAYASGIMSLTDALGLTNKPDYSEADMVLDATRGAGSYREVDFNPIGNYLRYTPFDREFYINQMNAQSGATRRAVLQNAGLNRGAGMAALLAADYNAQGQLGQLARQAEEYNLAQRQKVEEFNRATNMFNTEGQLKTDMANQEAALKARDSYLKGTLSAAELRQRERQQAAATRSANLSNFINSLGDIGRENFARNMIISDPSKYYTIGDNGKVTYKNGFDSLSDAEKRQVRGHAAEHGGTSFARGGYLTRRKRRK